MHSLPDNGVASPSGARKGSLLPSVSLRRLATFIAGLLVAAPAALAASDGTRAGEAADFAGSHTCVGCHAAEHGEWNTSQHHAAMQEATDATILGDFEAGTFSKDGITSTFFKKDGKFWVRTDGPDGELADFQIRYTFGLAPLQQYLIELSGGRLQALGIAWDSRPKPEGGQRWYHLYPNQSLKAGHPLHWTGSDQNWNYQCAYCHSTNLQKNYDATSRTFATAWSEISVGCEACHGPASGHLAWAARPGEAASSAGTAKGFLLSLDERRNVRWPMASSGQAQRSTPRTANKEIEVCAPCHARRQQFSAAPETLGHLFDAFRPALIDTGAYHADGQQRDEVYTYGSFLQSRMHAAGVTCSDCHNPHSGKLRHTGNAVCTQCHASERFDTGEHHHHTAGSQGAKCVSCHMPATTYMGVDPRHDHSMRIPRPDLSVLLATPNACSACHADRPATWARDVVKAWTPALKPGFQDFAAAFDLGDRRAPGAQSALVGIARAATSSGIARASAIARLREFPSAEALEIAKEALKMDAPAVRIASIAVISNADAATRTALLVPLLRDASRLVRMDAARALAGEASASLSAADRAALDSGIAEYVSAQLFNAERAESHTNLGNLYRDQGNMLAARASFLKAIELDATFVGAGVSLADLERAEGDEAAAEKVLAGVQKANPESGPVAHALALSLIRQKRTAEAMVLLAKAVEKAPEEPRFSYVLAVALHDTGKRLEAMDQLKNALVRHPYDRDILFTLASYEIESRDFAPALGRAELLSRLEPDDPQVARLIRTLRGQRRQ